MALKSMSIASLQDLKAKVDAAISEKVGARQKELEAELSKLEGYSAAGRRGRPAGRGGPRGAVAPKYRNPENSSETWAGRGLKPRWLTAAMKGGKKLEDFTIGGATKSAPAKKARKKPKGVKFAPVEKRKDESKQPKQCNLGCFDAILSKRTSHNLFRTSHID